MKGLTKVVKKKRGTKHLFKFESIEPVQRFKASGEGNEVVFNSNDVIRWLRTALRGEVGVKRSDGVAVTSKIKSIQIELTELD